MMTERTEDKTFLMSSISRSLFLIAQKTLSGVEFNKVAITFKSSNELRSKFSRVSFYFNNSVYFYEFIDDENDESFKSVNFEIFEGFIFELSICFIVRFATGPVFKVQLRMASPEKHCIKFLFNFFDASNEVEF